MSDSNKPVKVFECETYHTGPHVDQDLFNGPPGRYVREADFLRMVEMVREAFTSGYVIGQTDILSCPSVQRDSLFEGTEISDRLRAMMGE